MRLCHLWVAAALISLFASIAYAGRVRTLYTNDKVMAPVQLTMGRSTILRFDEKPIKAVVGNQNYFSLEFLGNDITIQPQGPVTTNLFVYTDYQTYGMILQVGSPVSYDDLVSVKWKPGFVSVNANPKKRSALVNSMPLNRKLEIKGQLHLTVLRQIRSLAQGVLIVEFTVENLSREKMPLSAVKVSVEGKDRGSPVQRFAMGKDELTPGESCQGRMILRTDHLDGLQFSVEYRGKSQTLFFPKKIS